MYWVAAKQDKVLRTTQTPFFYLPCLSSSLSTDYAGKILTLLADGGAIGTMTKGLRLG